MNWIYNIFNNCHEHYEDSMFQKIMLYIGLFSLLVLNFMALDRLKNDIYGWNWYLCEHRIWLVIVGTVLFTYLEVRFFKLWNTGFFLNIIFIIITAYIFYICYHNQFGSWLYDTKRVALIGLGLAVLFYYLFGWIGSGSGSYSGSDDGSEESDLNNEGIAGVYDDGINQYNIYGEPGNYYYYDDEGKGHHIYQNDPNAIFW